MEITVLQYEKTLILTTIPFFTNYVFLAKITDPAVKSCLITRLGP